MRNYNKSVFLLILLLRSFHSNAPFTYLLGFATFSELSFLIQAKKSMKKSRGSLAPTCNGQTL